MRSESGAAGPGRTGHGPEVSVLPRFLRRRTAPKVFGIGLIKTGTTSLGAALAELGYRHTSQRRNALLEHVRRGELEPIYRWVDRHDSFDDWPWPFLYEPLSETYPRSRFILTVRRDPETWLDSVLRHCQREGASPGRAMFFGHEMPEGNEEAYLARYLEHNEAVRRHFRHSPERLLEVCWEDGDGWEPLCRFLGLRAPQRKAFPALNTRAQPIAK